MLPVEDNSHARGPVIGFAHKGDYQMTEPTAAGTPDQDVRVKDSAAPLSASGGNRLLKQLRLNSRVC